MELPREEIGLRDTLPKDFAGYVLLGMRVIREACKDVKYRRSPRQRKAIRWLETYESDDVCTLGWYLDHIAACGVSLPPRAWFRILAEEARAGVKWKRNKNGTDTKTYPEGYFDLVH